MNFHDIFWKFYLISLIFFSYYFRSPRKVCSESTFEDEVYTDDSRFSNSNLSETKEFKRENEHTLYRSENILNTKYDENIKEMEKPLNELDSENVVKSFGQKISESTKDEGQTQINEKMNCTELGQSKDDCDSVSFDIVDDNSDLSSFISNQISLDTQLSNRISQITRINSVKFGLPLCIFSKVCNVFKFNSLEFFSEFEFSWNLSITLESV